MKGLYIEHTAWKRVELFEQTSGKAFCSDLKRGKNYHRS